MGGGNAQKTAMARQKRQAELKKAGAGSQAKANASAQTIICQVCRSTFVCTSSRASLTDHSSNKHPKHQFEQCFQGFTGA